MDNPSGVTFKRRKNKGNLRRAADSTLIGVDEKRELSGENVEETLAESNVTIEDETVPGSTVEQDMPVHKDKEDRIEVPDQDATVVRPSVLFRSKRRPDAESAIAINTRKKLQRPLDLGDVSYASSQSALPDSKGHQHKVAVEIESVKRADPNKPKWLGPARQAANVRTISRFDYQPNLCKDYNETGYCGFGDSCKFHHDRGDYKSGWELEKEWEAEQERKRKAMMGGEAEEAEEDYRIKDEDEFPWACLICRGDFVRPVVTKCKHYFCEKCALARFVKDTKCAACNEQTMGIFNSAFKLIEFLEQKKKLEGDEESVAEPPDVNKPVQGWVIP